ncbi:MAG: efflux RND transporter periplasmic adaptor subunit [bacterium]
MKQKLKYLLPLLIVGVSALGALVIVVSRPDIQPLPPENLPKLVRVIPVQQQTVQLNVSSQGTVTPRTASTLVAQVAGRITTVSPSFVAGGFFEKGAVLLSLDSSDYELAITQAKYQAAQAELTLKLEEQQAEIAREEWYRLNDGEIPPLVAREPQLKQAKAALEAAQATLAQAKLNLQRTQIKAPFAGRVRVKNVDVGQYVTPGMALAQIYAIDYAEVRLPLPDNELAFLDMPFSFRGAQETRKGPEVTLTANFAGQQQTWKGNLTRLEAEVDPRTRMVHAVARVENPYGKKASGALSPLTVGLFVQVEISGKKMKNVVVLPRVALRNDNEVLVVDAENKLRFREVDILKKDAENIYVRGGLQSGEQVCISQLEAVVDGMPVQPFLEETTGSSRKPE